MIFKATEAGLPYVTYIQRGSTLFRNVIPRC